LLVAALAGELFALHWFDTAQARLTDVFMRHHAGEFKADPNVVIIDVDDPSLRQMEEMAGLWPWPRETHADLLDGLAEFGPRAVVFDIAFSERDRKHPKSDARLSEALKATPAYLAATLTADAQEGVTPLRDLQRAFGIKKSGMPQAGANLLLPYAVEPQLWRLGLDNSEIDGDGVLRHYRLRIPVQGWDLPSLPARVAGDLGTPLPPGDAFLMTWPANGRVRYPYATVYLLLTEQRPAMNDGDLQALREKFHDKVVLIGSSATSSFDQHLTPLGASYPGVELVATAIDNLLNHNALRVISPWWAFGFGTMLIVCLALAFSRRLNPMLIGAVLLVVTAATLFAADQSIVHLWMLPVATPLTFAWTWYLVAAIAGYLREKRSREQAVALFGRFLNPAVVRKIVDQGETVESLSGRSCEITVLFSDIRGFTTLSEAHPPQKVVALLNRYFERQVEVVFRHGGTLDKFIGDCIMAFWGAPIDDPAHARRAVAAALEMQETLVQFRQELHDENSDLVDFDVGIGVHTGTAVVGFIGARRKLDYTAIGDTVNLASRVEGLTKGVARVLVSRETMEACAGAEDLGFDLRGSFAVKGRVADVELYEPKRMQRTSA
jgi:adenylate cyclase